MLLGENFAEFMFGEEVSLESRHVRVQKSLGDSEGHPASETWLANFQFMYATS